MASPTTAADATAVSAALDSSKTTTEAASSSMDLSGSGPTTAANNGGDRGNEWQKCLDNAVNSIVNIRVLQVKPFEATGSSSSYATGFCVSLEHSLILST